MSVLVDRDIEALVKSGALITQFERSSLEGASYDMRLSPQYIKEGKIKTLTKEEPTLVIKPGEFSILCSYEELNMPLNVIGHNGIMSPWAKRGLVSLFSPQIDPGFSGFLIVPVFNAGDAAISISRMDKIFTVEFVETKQAASYGWSSKHGRQNRLTVPVSPTHVRPNLTDIEVLQKVVTDIREKFNKIEVHQTSIDSEILSLRDRFGDARDEKNFKVSRQTMIVTIWALVIALLTLVGGTVTGVFGSDWLRDKVLRLFH